MNKQVTMSHIGLPVKNAEASAKFYEKYVQMKVLKKRTNPTNIWMGDEVRPFLLALLEETEFNPLAPVTHLGFTCSSCTQVDRVAAMAKEEGILMEGPAQEGWPGSYVAVLSDPDGHNVEISYNQEGAYNAIFEPVCDLEQFNNTMEDGQECWET